MKKVIAVLVALSIITTLAIGVFPTCASAINESEVQTRINNLEQIFGNSSYFTADGLTCDENDTNHISCDNCKLSNILQNNAAAQNAVDTSIFTRGNRWSCCAFAVYAFGYIFGHDPDNNTYKISSADYDGINETFLSQLRPGDFLKFDGGSHYAIYLSHNSQYIYLYHANTAGAGGAGKVMYNSARKISGYSSIVVTRSLSYDTTGASVPRVEHGYPGYTDVINDNNAVVHGRVYKTTGGDAQAFGIRVRLSSSTEYDNGWSYTHAASKDHSGSSSFRIWFDIQDEVGVTLTHATSYTYQLLAIIDGTEYWSEEKSFTTTGAHSYGAWTKENDSIHKRDCVTCGKSETANHNWDSGQITKQPTCDTYGIKTYTCTVCGGTKSDSLEPTNAHSYSDWSYYDFLTHTRTCSACQRTEMVNHNWGDPVTMEATCESVSIKIYTCADCKESYVSRGDAALGHSYKNGICIRCDAISFPDVTKSAWYYNAVQFAVKKGYFTGYKSGNFGPTDNITRQDFVVVLARIAGADLSKYSGRTGYPDVAAGSYYEAAVKWASSNGVVMGYNNGKFGVGDKITREQLVTILYRYAQKIGCDTSVPSTAKNKLTAYTDAGKITPYAKEAVIWALYKGVISGMTATTVGPQNSASRGQVATILMNISTKGIMPI